MAIASNLGFPRVGVKRELKKAVESYWKGETDAKALENTAAELRKRHWEIQKNAGIQHIPSNDFSFYDHVLDTIAMTGAVPARYQWQGGKVDLTTYFAMARGAQVKADNSHTHEDGRTCCHDHGHGKTLDVPAMEMTKWLDTNYHFIVPEFDASTKFSYASTKAVDQFNEAKKLGITTRPVLVGPVTFLYFGKSKTEGFKTLSLLEQILPVYEAVLKDLEKAGAEWVQIDEPVLALDIPAEVKTALKTAYDKLAKATKLKILVASYFERLGDNAETAFKLPVAALHVDLVRAPQQLEAIVKDFPKDKILSLGVVDGRNIWKTDLEKALLKVEKAAVELGKDRIMVAGSCSLLHSPVDLDEEKKLDKDIKNWMSFAKQKLAEINILTRAVNEGPSAVKAELDANKNALEARRTSKRIHNDAVKKRAAAATASDKNRKSDFKKRIAIQEAALGLPILPTTTIGSFPQTAEVRAQRASFKKGSISEAQYNQFLKEETERCVRFQEKLDIDVLVHGEFERNDMVEYFGENLDGFCFTENGWVQSYGSRCVKPPVIFGDVSRPAPITVEWAKYSQGLTKKIMKGMLTGPVCILQWSFVRDDQPRSETCKQIAFAMRDEVVDLEKAGIKIIQIDEAALREGLPLRKADWKHYLDWAVEAFRICASGVKDETQIHTHMCYSEFNDIIAAVADMDADVISIETSRSQMELLDAFVNFKYPNEIGPGVYDIHSPRVPSKDEMVNLLHKALKVLSPEQTWVNPDCGLKTRGWKEVEGALKLMVDAANEVRKELKSKAA